MNVLRIDLKVSSQATRNVAFIWAQAEGKRERDGDGSRTKLKLFYRVIKWVTYSVSENMLQGIHFNHVMS